ncbi:hypothetical protein D9M69_533120 [compost metagenome]
MHLGAGAAHDACGAVQFDVAEAEHGLGGRFVAVAAHGAWPAQVGAHAGEQFAGAEGLGEVVVGAGVECGDLVGFVGAGREHDDRHLRPAAHIADQRHTVAVGQAQVEHQQIGLARAGGGKAIAQGAGFVHLPAFGLERAAHEAADLRLVFDHDGGGGRHGWAGFRVALRRVRAARGAAG